VKPARVGLLLLAIVATQCGPDNPMRPSPPGPPLGGRNAVLIGAGDIGWCGSSGTAQTGRMIGRTPGDVFVAGDIAYPQGSSENFMNCFDPFWGHAAGRWLPVPGNHDYDTPGAAGYFDYFGPAAGPRGAGYYQRTLGEWQVLLINSNIAAQAGTPQYEFVRQALALPERRCQMAIWHHPVFTSGPNGPTTAMRQMLALLNDRGVDVVVNGHEHFYERFSRQDAEGRPTETGLRQFIVGTGGAPLYNFVTVAPNSAVRIASFGIIRFTLRPDAYDWEFEDVDGIIGDTGSTPCH
jgi:hypothetical protein